MPGGLSVRKWFGVLWSKSGDVEAALVRMEGADRNGVYEHIRGLVKSNW